MKKQKQKRKTIKHDDDGNGLKKNESQIRLFKQRKKSQSLFNPVSDTRLEI